jgi:Serine phosphatase RsbU, regulator of sigma subunit
MNERAYDQAAEQSVLQRAEPVRLFSSSALHAAKYFYAIRVDASLLRLADEFQSKPDLPAVAVLDEGGRTVGIARRDRLFALLGKPFGRDVLQKSSVAEVAEEAPRFDAHADLFTVAARMLPDAETAGNERTEDYCLLLGEEEKFLGLLSSQDLANYLSRMTQEDIGLAGRLQERLLSGALSPSEGQGWRIEAWSRPAKGVGGDFYFTKGLEDGKVFLALCDVSGKGVAASLVVAMVWGMLRMFDYSRGLDRLVEGLNEAVVSTFHLEKYLTGMFLIYDPAESRLRCADMGHGHAVLFRGEKALGLRCPRGNLPIGVETEIEPSVASYKLSSGDRLLVYSDGLTEQEDWQAEEYGQGRLYATAAEAMSRGQPLREAIPAALDEHRGATPQQDDMSFILLAAEEARLQSER